MTTALERTRQNYDRLARWYDLFSGSEKKFIRIGLDLLDVRPGERVLEIGPGTGHSLVGLAHHTGPRGLVAGLDLSARMVDIAYNRVQVGGVGRTAWLVRGNAQQLPFASNSYDVLFLSFTLELFEEIPALLSELSRVLRSGGRIGVVALAKRDTLACRLYEWGHRQWPGVLDCRPIHAGSLLAESGFQVKTTMEGSMWGLPVEIVVAQKG